MPQAQLDDALAQLSELGLAFRRGTPPDAVYTFKHALVQDAAYDSLLKSRRQELHAKIARVIEQRFPNIKTTEPEVLAHHLTAAGLTEAAIPLWQTAGELALKRMALTEAISHLNQGLELVSTLPPSSERDASELELRSLPWHRVGGPQKLARPGSLDQPASGPCLGEIARAQRRAGAHLLGTVPKRSDAGARSGVPALGGGDAGHRGGHRRFRLANHRTRTCLRKLLLEGRAHQGCGALRQGAGPLRRREASPSCGHRQPRSQNSSRYLRLELHLDAGLPGPRIAAER